jgi:hypothetical protein
MGAAVHRAMRISLQRRYASQDTPATRGVTIVAVVRCE